MSNLTVEKLRELLEVQKDFDSRIKGRNKKDTSAALIVEFVEWINTVEFFKNWKKKKGKEYKIQLSELADMLAFTLSKLLQNGDDEEAILKSISETVDDYLDDRDEESHVHFNSMNFLMYLHMMTGTMIEEVEEDAEDVDDTFASRLSIIYMLPFLISLEYYSIEELEESYKHKMGINHDRQDGKADKDKGYK